MNETVYLLHKEVIHGPVVIGASEDLHVLVLPLSRFHSNAADLNAAPPLYLGRWLLALF